MIHQYIQTISVRRPILSLSFFFQTLKVFARSQQSQQSGKLKGEKRGIFTSGSAAATESLAAAWSIDSNENGGTPPKPAAGFNLLRHDSILPQITQLPGGAETGRTFVACSMLPRASERTVFGKHTPGAILKCGKRGESREDGKTSDSSTVINSACDWRERNITIFNVHVTTRHIWHHGVNVVMSFLVSLVLFPNEMFLYLVLFGGNSGVERGTEQRNSLILQKQVRQLSSGRQRGSKILEFCLTAAA